MKVWRKKLRHTCAISVCAYIIITYLFTPLYAFDFEKFIEKFQENLDPEALADLTLDTMENMQEGVKKDSSKAKTTSPSTSVESPSSATPKTPYELFITPIFVEPKKEERSKQKTLTSETAKALDTILKEWEKNRKALQLKLDVKQDFSPIFRTHYLDKIRENGDRLFIMLTLLSEEVYRNALLSPATAKKEEQEKIKKFRQDLLTCLTNIKKYNKQITVLASQDFTVEKKHEEQITALAGQQTIVPTRLVDRSRHIESSRHRRSSRHAKTKQITSKQKSKGSRKMPIKPSVQKDARTKKKQTKPKLIPHNVRAIAIDK